LSKCQAELVPQKKRAFIKNAARGHVGGPHADMTLNADAQATQPPTQSPWQPYLARTTHHTLWDPLSHHPLTTKSRLFWLAEPSWSGFGGGALLPECWANTVSFPPFFSIFLFLHVLFFAGWSCKHGRNELCRQVENNILQGRLRALRRNENEAQTLGARSPVGSNIYSRYHGGAQTAATRQSHSNVLLGSPRKSPK